MGAAGLMFAQAGVGLFGSIQQANAIRAEGRYQKNIDDFNAEIADMKSADAIKRGERDATNLRVEGRRLIGRQRAAYAAQGVDVGSGSSLEVQADTAESVAEDALTIKNNAWREAWGYKMQASEFRRRGAMAERASKQNSRMTLLTGGLKSGFLTYKGLQ